MVIFSREDCDYIKSFYNVDNEIDGTSSHNFEGNSIKFRKGNSAKFNTFVNKDLHDFILEKLRPFKVKELPSIKIMKYLKGDGLLEHQDFAKYGVKIIFKTFLIQLSESTDYEGGDLMVEGKKQSREIGSLCTISPTDLHSVTQVTSGIRYSLVLFLYETNFDIKKSII